MQEKILYEIKDVTKKYGEGQASVYALDNISLNLEEGKFTVVLGASGSGKSTLLNLLGCMDRPTSGSILFEGLELANLPSKEQTLLRQKNIGFIFQSYNLIPTLTAFENIEFSCEIAGVDKRRAMEALEAVGLKDRRNHYLTQLSGGEQQRVSIARAIAKNPKVLLCDEPTGALDFETGIMILEVLKDIHRQGTSVILITHSQEIGKMADQIIRIRSGKILSTETNENPLSPSLIQW